MQSRRLARLNSLILQTISRHALTLKDPAVGFITFTEASASPDLSLVKVYYSVLGTDEQKEATAGALARARPNFRRELARLENLKKVPDILWVYDPGVERADRVHRLLNAIQEGRTPDVQDDSDR